MSYYQLTEEEEFIKMEIYSTYHKYIHKLHKLLGIKKIRESNPLHRRLIKQWYYCDIDHKLLEPIRELDPHSKRLYLLNEFTDMITNTMSKLHNKQYNFTSLMKEKVHGIKEIRGYGIQQSTKYPGLCISIYTIDITDQIQSLHDEFYPCIDIIVIKGYK